MNKAMGFFVGLSFVTAILAVTYGFLLLSQTIIDWGIFLTVFGFIVLLFLGVVFLVPRD
jgi:hypothetical protein